MLCSTSHKLKIVEGGIGMIEVKIREQVVQIPDNDIYEMDGGKQVIKLARMEALADKFEESVPVPQMLYAFVDNNNNLAVAFACSGVNKDGRVCYSVGEASSVNLDGDVACAFPTIMAANRSRVRWITQALGVSGQVYSDIEFAKPNAPVQMDEKTMRSLSLPFGKNKGKTLGQLLDSEEGCDYLGWLVNNYEPRNVNQKMLVESADLLLQQAEAIIESAARDLH